VAPEGGLLTDLLVALTRLPRGKGDSRDASLIRALARDLGLEFDPLDCVMSDPWTGVQPAALDTGGVWRSTNSSRSWRTNSASPSTSSSAPLGSLSLTRWGFMS